VCVYTITDALCGNSRTSSVVVVVVIVAACPLKNFARLLLRLRLRLLLLIPQTDKRRLLEITPSIKKKKKREKEYKTNKKIELNYIRN
jgi:hypothetical protein